MKRSVLSILICLSPLSLWAQPGQAWATDVARERAKTVTPVQQSRQPRQSSSGVTDPTSSISSPRQTLGPNRVNTARPLIPGESHLNVSATTPELSMNRPYTAHWSLQLGGQFIRDTLANQKTQSALGLNLGLDYAFTEMFSLSIRPRVSFRNGHIQAATSSNGRENSLELINAVATFSDNSYFALTAGAMDMTQSHSSLLVASTFPAAKVLVSTGEQRALSLSASALTAVPSSATLTNNSQDYDKTPSFQSAAIRLTYQGNGIEGMAQVSQFQYKDLPLNVSSDSTFLGNTPLGPDNSPQTEFRYQFAGQELRFGAGLRLSRRLQYRFNVAALRNQEAPAGLGQGYLLANQLDYVMSGNWTLAPSFTYFRVEPDATIANYNDAMTTTNRVGYAIGMGFHYQKMFKVGALGGEREVVFLKTSQARERFMNLTLETFDVPF